MRICKIWDADYPWDVRVEKVTRTLISQNYEIFMVCRNMKRNKLEEIYEGISLHRLPYLPSFMGKINNLFTFPFFFSPIWLHRIGRTVKKNGVDLILVRDLPMALAAILIGKINKIPVIMDMAECYPEMLKLDWFPSLSNLFIRNPLLAYAVERITLKYIDHIIVVIEESKQRLVKKGFPAERISIVKNTPELRRFQLASIDCHKTIGRKQLNLIYVGLLNPSRGLDIVLKSLGKYVKTRESTFLTIVGSGKVEKDLREMCEKLNLQGHVTFEGWVNNSKIPEYIGLADVCLVPHRYSSHWNNTIPNKLFDYMAAGKPVLVSNVTPVERIVNEEKCGEVYEDGNVESFCYALDKLQDADYRKLLGDNGRRAVIAKYNWDIDSKELIKIFEIIRSRLYR